MCLNILTWIYVIQYNMLYSTCVWYNFVFLSNSFKIFKDNGILHIPVIQEVYHIKKINCYKRA